MSKVLVLESLDTSDKRIKMIQEKISRAERKVVSEEKKKLVRLESLATHKARRLRAEAIEDARKGQSEDKAESRLSLLSDCLSAVTDSVIEGHYQGYSKDEVLEDIRSLSLAIYGQSRSMNVREVNEASDDVISYMLPKYLGVRESDDKLKDKDDIDKGDEIEVVLPDGKKSVGKVTEVEGDVISLELKNGDSVTINRGDLVDKEDDEPEPEKDPEDDKDKKGESDDKKTGKDVMPDKGKDREPDPDPEKSKD